MDLAATQHQLAQATPARAILAPVQVILAPVQAILAPVQAPVLAHLAILVQRHLMAEPTKSLKLMSANTEALAHPVTQAPPAVMEALR